MIKSFTIQNFRSILDLTIDFTYDEGKAPNGYKEMETLPFLEVKKNKKNPIRLVPCMALYGANAAGKSSIIDALYTLKNLINFGITEYQLSLKDFKNYEVESQYQPNKLNRKYDATTFIIEIVIEKNIYKYELQYNDNEILKEILIVDNKKIYSINKGALETNNIATKTYNTKKLQEIYKVECCDDEKVQQKTFLNIISINYAGLNKSITNFNKYINTRMLMLHNTNIGFSLELLEKECKIEKHKTLEEIFKILRKLDSDIIKLELKEELLEEKVFKGGYLSENLQTKSYKFPNSEELIIKNNNLYKNRIFSYHRDIDGKEVEFDFRKEESFGTYMLLIILGEILLALKTGAVLCIDELERSIHPLLLREIVEIFKSKRYNKDNAQLVFTTHNVDILDEQILRISEIAFISKDIEDGTIVRKASAFEGVRNVDNFRKRYLNGEFSAIPSPYI